MNLDVSLNLSSGDAAGVAEARVGQPSLFDGQASTWNQERDAAFETWWQTHARDQSMTDASERTYRDMWRLFSAWMTVHAPDVSLQAITPPVVKRFIVARDQHGVPRASSTRRYQWRLARLIDLVLSHHAHANGLTRNTAAADVIASSSLKTANVFRKDELPNVYSNDEAARIIRFVSAVVGQKAEAEADAGAQPHVPPASPGFPPIEGTATSDAVDTDSDALLQPRWQAVRNAALVACHLGAGLTPSEARRLALQDMKLNRRGADRAPLVWGLRVAPGARQPSRDTPVARWAGVAIGHWLLERQRLGVSGDRVFPRSPLGEELAEGPHYRGVQRVLRKAGLEREDAAGGSFRLRHTFAMRQLKHRNSVEQVARWIGVQDLDLVARYGDLLDSAIVTVV